MDEPLDNHNWHWHQLHTALNRNNELSDTYSSLNYIMTLCGCTMNNLPQSASRVFMFLTQTNLKLEFLTDSNFRAVLSLKSYELRIFSAYFLVLRRQEKKGCKGYYFCRSKNGPCTHVSRFSIHHLLLRLFNFFSKKPEKLNSRPWTVDTLTDMEKVLSHYENLVF